MRILPVIDVKDGCVVRGVGGRRDEYRPISSRLCHDASRAAVCRAWAERQYSCAYVADLDAILSGDVDRFVTSAHDYTPLELIVDAGIRNASDALRLAQVRVEGRPLAGIVAGLETVASPTVLSELLSIVGAERLVFSLDLKHGQPLTDSPAWRQLAPLAIAKLALRLGVRRFIVLDLARVGLGRGVGTEPLCRALRCLDATIELIAGGGVRSTDDLEALSRAGCDAALVASALHDGRLDARQLAHGWPPR